MTPAPTILDTLDDPGLFAEAFAGPSWRPWRAFLAALFGLPADNDAQALARACTGRADALAHGPYREAWLICGRRSGKSATLALVAVYLACFRNWRPRLRAGEVGVIAILAADRDQAGVILGYVKGLLAGNPLLAPLVTAEGAGYVTLGSLSVSIEVHTSNFRSPRGRTLIAALLDETAFWQSDTSASPAVEVTRALRPSLATLAPDSILIGASSPYRRDGLLWNRHKAHHGREGSRVLVWQAPTLTMNPGLDPQIVADAYEDDPEAASAEYGAQFRIDIARFVPQEVIDAATIPGRHELPRIAGVSYRAFIDPSGGSSDSFTLAIAHREGTKAVLDVVREVRPPFAPATICANFAAILKGYESRRAVSDKYAGAWVTSTFSDFGITIEQSARPKSEIYGELLPALNSGQVELLDNPRLAVQLANLERRTSRSGKDSIDHPPGAHDDLINAAAGALVAVLARVGRPVSFAEDLVVNDPYVTGGELMGRDEMPVQQMDWGYR